MRRAAKGRQSAGSGDTRQVQKFPSPWTVCTNSQVASLNVKIPALRLQEKKKKKKRAQDEGLPVDSELPKFLRLDMRRPGLAGKLAPRPVLKAHIAPGVSDDWLTVSTSFARAITNGAGEIVVTSASERAFRMYRLCRSVGSLFGAVATIISGLLVGLGTAPGSEAPLAGQC